jgi:ATP-dependent exoDNAse (exonuclease V) beta subunit
VIDAIDGDRFRHTCILASAGSGKTFSLSNRYLSLIAAGADAGTILATTFTRLAAGQIRDGIRPRLADAADDEEKRSQLSDFIGMKLSRGDVLRLLRTLTRELHRMQIRTLDSFFASVVRSFAIELEIAPGSDVVDEHQDADMRTEAVRLMLDERDPQQLIDLLRLLTQGASERSVMGVIDRTVTRLYELYRQAEPEAWAQIEPREELSMPAVVEATLRVEDLPPTGKKSLDGARAKDVGKAWAHDWPGFLASGLPSKIAAGEMTFNRVEIPPDLSAAYEPLIEHARAVVINRVRDQTIATRDLLALFDAKYRAIKRREASMTFADITDATVRAQRLGRFDEICFRLDAAIRHLLLDEFQDTNVPQWSALRPIADELVADMSELRSFFCVGDVKQSIYGWRDACPEVLDEIPRLLVGSDGESVIDMKTLARSYRSSQVVIDAVNEVFGSLEGNAALEEHGDAAERFARGFERHETDKTELAGCAELRTVPYAADDEDQSDCRLRSCAMLVKRLHDRAPGKSIAVLTRTNKAVARLLFEFSHGEAELAASGRGGGPLTDAPAVTAILDLLTLADHPDDTIAAFNVARGPLGRALDFVDESRASRRRALAGLVRRQLLDRGYARTIAAWAIQIAPACDERQHQRVLQLIELAGEYDERATLRADDFVRLVENRAVELARPAPVQVMTVHQAKGLEFDIVVLPELETLLTGSGPPPVVIDRDGPTGPITRICRWVSESTRDLLPEIKPMFDRHRRRTVRESLCLLYVAMTRARQGLYMLIDPPRKLKKGGVSANIPKSAAGVLRCALGDGGSPEADAILYSRGDEAQSLREEESKRREAPAAPAPVGAIRFAPSAGASSRAAAPSPSALADAGASLRSRLALTDDEARQRGSAIHALMERIEWIEQFQPDRTELESITRAIAPRRGGDWARRIVTRFLNAIENPAVRAALSREGCAAPAVEVWRERPFVRLVDGGLQRGFIDRLVVELDADGSPRRATVIDFKTDEIDEADAGEHAEHYRGQLETYREAAAAMLNVDLDAVAMQLLFVAVGALVTLPSR